MFVGHFAVGLIGKRIEPKVSLGTLVLAAMLPDFVAFVLMIAGIEGVRFKPGVVVTPGMRRSTRWKYPKSRTVTAS